MQNAQATILVKAKAFDWWFSRFTVLYDVLLLVLGPRLRKALPHIRGPRVLEVSFGVGYLMAQYAAKYEVTGIDYNPAYVAAARKRLEKRDLKARLIQGDAHALPFEDESFETLVNTDAFTLYEDPQKAMREFYRVLVPGGRVVLMEFNYPKDKNWFGTLKVNLARRNMPYVDFDQLFASVGFSFDDYNVGGSGSLHMYVATKPKRIPAIASETT